MKLYGKIEPWGIKEISKQQFNRLVSRGGKVRYFHGVDTSWDVVTL